MCRAEMNNTAILFKQTMLNLSTFFWWHDQWAQEFCVFGQCKTFVVVGKTLA